MVIQCNQCQTKFRLPAEKLKPGGVKVRCSHCKQVFTVMPQDEPVEESPAVAVPEEPKPPVPEESMPPVQKEDVQTTDTSGESFAQDTFPQTFAAEDKGEDAKEEVPGEFDFGDFDEPAGGPSAEESFSVSENESLAGIEFDSRIEADESVSSSESASGEQSSGPSEFDFDSAGGAEDEFGFSGSESKGDESAFDFDDEAGGPSEFDFDDESVSSGDLGFGGESASSDEFDFDEDAGESGESGDAIFEESGASDEFDFGDVDPFAESEPTNEHADEGEFKFTELPLDSGTEKKTSELGGGTESTAFATTEPTEDDFDAHLSDDIFAEPPLPPAKGKKGKKTTQAKKGKKAKGPMSLVLRLVLLMLLGLSGAVGYLYWQTGDLSVLQMPSALPSLEEIVDRLAGGSGSVQVKGHIELTGESGRYVKNKTAGSLLVIEGKAVNRYPQSRSIIQVRGLLYDSNGKLLGKQAAYCGNRLSDSDLQQLPYAKIEEAMSNTFGEALSNLEIAPGKDISFVIAFKDLPADLDSFAVEVVDSQPAAPK